MTDLHRSWKEEDKPASQDVKGERGKKECVQKEFAPQEGKWLQGESERWNQRLIVVCWNQLARATC